jgi:Skp family chaperone for outer membrane proteins
MGNKGMFKIAVKKIQKAFSKWVFMVVGVVLPSIVLAQDASSGIGIVGLDKFTKEGVLALSSIDAKMSKHKESVQKIIAEKQKFLEERKKKLEKLMKTGPRSEAQKEKRAFELIAQAYQSEVGMRNQQLSLGFQQAMAVFEKTFAEVIESVAKKRRLKIVLSRQSSQAPTVLWTDHSVLDISNDVIAGLNEKLKEVPVSFPTMEALKQEVARDPGIGLGG